MLCSSPVASPMANPVLSVAIGEILSDEDEYDATALFRKPLSPITPVNVIIDDVYWTSPLYTVSG